DVLHVAGELGSVDDDAPFLVRFKAVEGADERGLAGTRRAADDHFLAAAHPHVDAPQHVKVPVPLVQVLDDDDVLRRGVSRGCAGTSGLLKLSAQCPTSSPIGGFRTTPRSRKSNTAAPRTSTLPLAVRPKPDSP